VYKSSSSRLPYYTILRSFLYITTLLSSLYLFAIIRLANLLEVEIIIVVSSTFRSLIAL
jgi:hypothetical protein